MYGKADAEDKDVVCLKPISHCDAGVSSIGVLLLVLVVLSGIHPALSQATPDKATLVSGTRLMVRTVDAVDSENSQPDQRFRGSLETNLMAGDVLVAPKGTTVFGRLLAAGGGQLEFDLTDIMINGQTYSLATSSNQAQGQESPGQTGTGAKVGATVGALAGGLSGAIVGAGAGAVGGRAVDANTRGAKVKVPAGTLVEFTLAHPVSLPVAAK